MTTSNLSLAIASLLTLSLAGSLHAQDPAIQRLIPAAADSGDTLIIEGSNLGDVSSVQFEYSAQISTSGPGMTGMQTVGFNISRAVVSATPNRVVVVVPATNAQSGLPTTLGTVRTFQSGGIRSDRVDFRFLELSDGAVESTGLGTTLSTGLGRAVTTFVEDGDLPFQDLTVPSDTEELLLQNAPPGALAVLAGGFLAAQPLAPIGDGLLAIGPELFDFGQGITSAEGELAIPVTIPRPAGLLGLEFGFQFLVVDPSASVFGLGVTTGLSFDL